MTRHSEGPDPRAHASSRHHSEPAAIVPRQPTGARRSRTMRRHPVVYASVSEPCGTRSRWLVVTSACPACGGRHVHYAAALAAAGGARRAGCGRGIYWIAVARVYRGVLGIEDAA